MVVLRTPRLPGARLTLQHWSLLALVSGASLGLVGHRFEVAWLLRASTALSPIGSLWVNALQMAVLPLLITQLLSTLVRVDPDASIGRIGRGALLLFLSFLTIAGVLAAIAATQAMAWLPPSGELLSGWRTAQVAPAAVAAAPVTLADWMQSLVPRNPFEAAARGSVLQLLVFTVLFGVAAGRLPQASRESLARPIQALAEAMMTLVHWILLATPFGVFVLILGVLLRTGVGALQLIGVYIVGTALLMILFTIVLYPVTALAGGVSMRRFARGVAPAQLVAAGTQSSLASLPALVQGAKDHLELPPSSSGFSLTLAVSTFKLNQPIYLIFQFILLAHVFAVPLSVEQIGTYLLATILFSFSVAGIPGGGGAPSTLPLLIAMGLPIEGAVLLDAANTIPDIFMTVLNVTADMSVATILARRIRPASPTSDAT
ncbi:dicarboxylate/amino acid:cation symporter [Gemmatimonas sp.]|uniref:dicarboxylate/amino acid:cation symporter n=1 Tax=Gemmatimonas sp. TaxID=1962908 RepID=UPI0037BED76B